ncbi:hypothetical protein KSP39_PZI004875 [Platanthera zijinensis]|uniref:Uncharacterized protein n=1 Tax=Platanthera zijinensis TaxID=2320716 RepID=A0AAP0BWE8_9ASPA
MSTLANFSSPGSLQVRSIRRGRESPSAFLHIKFRASRRRIVLVSASLGSTTGGREGQSWSISSRSPDPFSGWSGTESEGGGNSEGKGGRGGMLGVGLAGIFLLGGVTFATLSLRSKTSRITSGVGQQMKPLTTEQEVLLTFDDQSAGIDKGGNGTTAISDDKESKIDNHYPDSVTGINKDPFLPLENCDVTEDKHDIVNQLGVTSAENFELTDESTGSMDSFSQALSEDDAQIDTDVNDASVSQAPNNFSPDEYYSNNAIDLVPGDQNTRDLQTAIFSGTPDSVLSHEENTRITDKVYSIPLNTLSTDYVTDKGNPSLEEIVKSNVPLDISSEYEDSTSESLTIRDTNKGSINYVGSQFRPQGALEIVDFVSMGDDLQDGGFLHLSSEPVTLGKVENTSVNVVSTGIDPSSELGRNEAFMFPADSVNTKEYILDDTNSKAYSALLYSNHTRNDSNINTRHLTNKDSRFESTLPQKSFSFTGIPAPSLVSSALEVPPGKVLVPAVVDQVQSQALAALQVLKIKAPFESVVQVSLVENRVPVIEASVQPGDLCTRREYARWLVSASSALSRGSLGTPVKVLPCDVEVTGSSPGSNLLQKCRVRNAASKLYPAMFIENVTVLAFDDVTAEDPDFSSIQEAGIIYSKLSLSDTSNSSAQSRDSLLFSPESPLSRQDLVSWKMALERKRLPEVDKNLLYQISGFIDIDKIDPGAWPALLADISSGDQSIISLAFGYTRLFQPNKPVTKSQAAIALATGEAAEIVGEELTRIEAESLAETAVNAHTALVAQVEKDINASFEQELAKEREKIDALEKLAEEARQELERIRAEREEENDALLKGKVAVKSELELLSTLKSQVEQQIQELMGSNVEISFERERITKLREDIEGGNQSVIRLQYELEVERKALSMARTWAEEEAKRARELARALEEARERWANHGIKVVVDEDLQEDASAGITWVTAGKQAAVDETIIRGESLVEKLKAMADEIKHKSSIAIKSIIDKISSVIYALKRKASESSTHAGELRGKIVRNAGTSVENIKESASAMGSNVALRARRAIDDCKENVDKFSVKFKA